MMRIWLGVACVFLRLVCWTGLAGAEETGRPLSNEVAVAAQWRAPAVDGAGGATLEVFISNVSSNPTTFASMVAGGSVGTNVVWQQFYPSSNAAVGETIAGRICFREAPLSKMPLTVSAADGRSLALSVPGYKASRSRMGAITFSRDYKRVFLQYLSKKAPPRKLLINGREVIGSTLRRAQGMDEYDLFACDAPFPITTGLALFIDLEFKDRTHAYALLRALNGIVLDAWLIPEKERSNVVVRLSLSSDPPQVEFGISSFNGDPACYDSARGQRGAAATNIISERQALYRKHPHKLSFIFYCTAFHPALWDLYGAISDGAFAAPYCFNHWQDVSRWLDNEESFMEKARASTRPAAWGWIPDAVRRKARFAEPEEIQTLAWVALLKGCKVIKYFAYHLTDPAQESFDKTPALLEAIADLNEQIGEKQELLAPLLPVSERIEAHPAGSGIKIYTAWAGDLGILVLLRNLDYRTDDQANDSGRAPRFQVTAKTNLTVALSVPAWLNWQEVKDFLTDETLPTHDAHLRPVVEIAELKIFKVLWLQNMPPTIAALSERGPSGSVMTGVATALTERSTALVPYERIANYRFLMYVVFGFGGFIVIIWLVRRCK